MNRNEILEKVSAICKDIFEEEDLVINEGMTSEDIENWDSLSHLLLVNEISEAFNIQLSLDEINNSHTIGQLIDTIIKHKI